MKRVSVAGILLACCAQGCGIGTCPDAFYELLAADPEVRLPEDERPHCYTGGEWWYYSGVLTTGEPVPRTFGFHAAIFHVPRWPVAKLDEFWIAHYSVTDIEGAAFRYDQIRVSGASVLPQPVDGFDVAAGRVHMSFSGESGTIAASMADGSDALELALRDAGGPVFHQERGYVPFNEGDSVFYYSRPQMAAFGSLEVDGQRLTVTGDVWFDRQWGLNLNDPFEVWDWFSIRLEDGTTAMLYDFPASPSDRFGTLIAPDGTETLLGADDFEIARVAAWKSPVTRITYNTAWQVTIGPRVWNIEAVVDDQEFDARPTTFNVYWEGLCRVQETAPGAGGWAFVEQANVRYRPRGR